MARAITKSLASSIVFGLDANKEFDMTDDGAIIPNVTVQCDGVPSETKALNLLAKKVGHRNVMVLNVQTDETKLSLSAAGFLMNSMVCKENEVYGHDFVTQTVKITVYNGFAVVDGKPQPFIGEWIGETTKAKVLKAERDARNSRNVVVTSMQVKEERRYMSRELYLKLAKREAAKNVAAVEEEEDKQE